MRGGRYNMNRGVKRGGGHYDSGGGAGNRMDHSNRHNNSRFGNNHYNGRGHGGGRGGNKRQFSTSIRDNHGGPNDNDAGHYDSRNRNSDLNHNRHDNYQYRRGRDNSRERNNERKRLRHDDYRTLSSNLSRNNRSPPTTMSSTIGNSYRSSIGLGGSSATSTAAAAATSTATSNNRGESNRRIAISRTSNRYRTRGNNAGQTVRIVRRGAITKPNDADLRNVYLRRKYINIQHKDRNKLLRASSSRLSRNSQIKIARKRKSESRDAQTKKRKSTSPYRRSTKSAKSIGITKAATSPDIDDKKVSSGDEAETTKAAVAIAKDDVKPKTSSDSLAASNDSSSSKSMHKSPKSYESAEKDTTIKKESSHDAKKCSKEHSNHHGSDYDDRKDKERSRKSIALSKDISDNNNSRASIEKNVTPTKSAIQAAEPSIKSENKTDVRTLINLTCVHCQLKYATFKQYSDHLHSYTHKASLKEVAMRQRLYLLGLRTRQRSVQRLIEKNNKEEYEPKFCHLCRLHYRLPQAKHQLSEHHKYMKNFLMPYCAPCRVAFKSPMSFEMHRSTIDHLKCQAYHNTGSGSDSELTIREIDLNNFVTVDSVGEIDLDKQQQGKTIVSDELKQKLKDQAKYKDAVSLDLARNEEKPMGAQYIKYIAAYYCEICDVLAEANEDLKTDVVRHCAERKHQMNYTKRKIAVNEENTEKVLPKDENKNDEVATTLVISKEKTAAQKAKQLEDALDLDDDEKLWASLEKDLGDLLEAVPDDLDDTEDEAAPAPAPAAAVKRKSEAEEEEDEAVLNIHIGSFSEFFKDELRKDVDETVIKKEQTPTQAKSKDIKRIKSVSVNKIETKD